MEDAEFIKSYEQDIKRLNCKYADEHYYDENGEEIPNE